MTTADKTIPDINNTEAEVTRPDTPAARIARFAIGSLFGVVFLGLCFIMLTTALKGPDTIKATGVAAGVDKFGLLTQPPDDRLKAGDVAPDFVLQQVGGDPVQLSKLQGKTVLVNFWATWCEGCRDEMPAIERFYEKYKDQNVVVLAIDLQETADAAKGYFKDNNLKMPILLDATGEVPGGYKATGVPESYFVDKSGKVQAFSIGLMDDNQLEQNIQTTWKAGGK